MAKAKGNGKLITVCVIVYLICLIALTPLNVVYKAIAPNQLPVDIVAVTGTLWNGNVVLKHPLTGQVDAKWQLEPLSLLTGSLTGDLNVEANQVELKGKATFNSLSKEVELSNVNGFISASLINQFIEQSKTQINGDLELNRTNLQYNLATGESSSASGQLVWQGGQVNYPKGRNMASANLPMLVAKISSENSELTAAVSTAEGLQVANASLKKDGWANVAVRKAMVDLVGEKWPNKVSADAVVFEISERVFARE